MTEAQEFNQIIRLLNTDINGNMQVQYALTKVRGIGFTLSNAICNTAGINKKQKMGYLSQEQLKKIESTIKNNSFPDWLLNRRKDKETGQDKHLLTADLKFQKEMDIKHLRKIKCYRGVRHSLGLPVRGQRTRSNFRKGKTVGVRKKSLKIASAKKTGKK